MTNMAISNNKISEEMNELTLSRSNAFIQSKHNCSLTENKLIALGLATVKMDHLGIPYSDIPVAALKQFEGIEPTNIYKKVKEIAQCITTHTVICEEKIQGQLRLEVFTLVNNAEYIDGAATFRLTFNPSIVPMISNIQAPYTTLRIKTLMSFKNNYAYRLYELLATKEYLLYPKQKAQAIERVTIKYDNINELRMQLTLVQVDDEKNKALLSKPYEQLTIDERAKMDKIIEKGHYKDWRDFKKSVIEVAKEHMSNNPLCPITFDYEPIRSGRGGKVVGVKFYVYKNEKYILANEHVIQNFQIENNNLMDKVQQVRAFMEFENISDYNIVALLEEAEYDVAKVKAAYNLALKQEVIDNLVGWLLVAIRENWAEQHNISILKGRDEKETEEIRNLYQEQMKDSIETENAEQFTFDFENNEIVVEEPKTEDSLNERFIELFMKSSKGELDEKESEEMKKFLKEFAEKKLNES